MSYKASAWAVKQRVGNPTRKLVLLALAENANHNGYSPVGFKYLTDVAECSAKSVQRHLEALESMGLLVRQRRRRKDGSLAGYDMWLQLHQTRFQFEDDEPADKLTTGQNDRWTPDEGTQSPLVEDTESTGEGQRVHSFPSVPPQCSSPVEPARAREAVDNSTRSFEWRGGHYRLINPPPDLDLDVLREWLDWRKDDRRMPVSDAVIQRALAQLREAVAQGWDATEALRACLVAGWTEPNAAWLRNRYAERESSARGGGGDAAAEAWARLVRHCRDGHSLAVVERESPDLVDPVQALGGMAYLRGLTERDMEFQARKFRSIYQNSTAATAAAGG